MSVEPLISLQQYLNTSYDPDVEYVDGVLVERNVGKWLHSLIQRNIVSALDRKYPHIYVMPELRCQTTATRYRLPDVCVVLAPPNTDYLLDAAFLAIEILSGDERMSRTIAKLDQYDRKGVANIWVIDSELRKMSVFSRGTLGEIRDDRLVTNGEPRLELTREEIFRGLN